MTRDGEWVTQRQAAELLGVHVSLVGKMVARGDLHPRRALPSLSRREVIELAEQRAQPKPPPPPPAPPAAPKPPWVASPPDDEHDWLSSDGAADLLGLSRNGVNLRAQKGKLPHAWHDGRRWFRRDHLELVLRAESARRTMQG